MAVMDVEFPIRNDNFADFYATISDIGRGKFALVKRCRHLESDVEYAAKFLRKRRCGKDCRSAIIREIDMLRASLKHPNVINVVEVFETRQEIIIVTEYAAGGELFQHMIVEDCFQERDVIRLMRQIIDGVKFLHNASIVHLDIKPQNILLTKTPPHGDIKLCDFGFARHVCKGTDILDIVGTPDYVAPEVLSYEPIQTACDMWSIGVLTYVMLTGCSPFAADTKQETFLNISQVNLDFPEELYDGISNDAIDFITGLLVKDPRKRMTVHECAEHKWLSEDNKPCVLPMVTPPLATSTTSAAVISSPIGCRRALSSSSDSAVAPEPVKRQCCIDENELSDTNDCRLPFPMPMTVDDHTTDASQTTTYSTTITSNTPSKAPANAKYQEISVEAIIECSQHTTTTTLPLPDSNKSNGRLGNSDTSSSQQSTEDINEDIILLSTSCSSSTISSTSSSSSASTSSSSSSSKASQPQEEVNPEPEQSNSTAKSYTVSKEFTIERHNEISLKLEVRGQDGGLVVQRSPLLVRRTDSERQLVC